MKIKFNKKNPLFAFVLSILLLAGTMLIGAPAANADTTDADAVSLYYVDSDSIYAGGSVNHIYIKVANLGYEKDVKVHYYPITYSSSEWKTQDAEYVTSLDSNYDIFKASISSFGMEYYITYTVNGKTYTTNKCMGTLGSANVLALRNNSDSASCYEVKAIVRGSGNVKVVYTTDKWKTVKEQELSYNHSESDDCTVYSTYLNLGNSNDVLDNFEYAICYTRDGNEYWDNNFGKNYDSSYHNHH